MERTFFSKSRFSFREFSPLKHLFNYLQVPDHTIKDINGASFAGFYYICFQKSKAIMEGYYYHRSSEWFQSLTLEHVPESCIQIYEFR